MKTFPGESLISPALWTAARLRVAQWDRLTADPERLQSAQLAQLRRNCQMAARTEFGRAHGLGEVHTHAQFRDRVPLRTYAGFEPYLERMRRGARDVLWPGLIPYFGQSSGSSGTSAQHKFLPISAEQIRWQQRAGFDVLARYVTQVGHGRVLGGYTLGLFPPSTLVPEGEVHLTNNPGLMQRHLPWPVREAMLPERGLRDLPHYDEKLERMAEAYLDHDVRALSGTTCWFSIFFDKLLQAARRRGRRVSAVSELWPNLSVLFGGGIPAEPYAQIISRRVGRPVALMDNYNATEGGLFAVTDHLGQGGLRVIPDRGVFFELVPLAEHGQPSARRVPLWAVEPGAEYAVALTTSSGLFGYSLGDSVRFQSVFPHRLELTGRVNGVLSLTQELTSLVEIERAVDAASSACACSVVEFSAAAEVGVEGSAKGRYQLYVEFERAPSDLEVFRAAFDAGLCRQNRVYREHRSDDVAILPPVVFALARGSARRLMGALGRESVQQKFPRIVDEARRAVLASFIQRT